MTTPKTPNHDRGITTPDDLVPTSSRPRPATGTTSPNRPRPSSPTLPGDEVDLSRRSHPTNNTPDLVPGTRSNQTPFNPGTTWLITPRCAPAWAAVLALLDDNQWHDTTDIHDAMRAAADLAPRTIEHHLRSASVRRWITRRGHRIRLRDRDALEQALDAAR